MKLKRLCFMLFAVLICSTGYAGAADSDWFNGDWVLDVDASVEYASTFSTRSEAKLKEAYGKNKDRFKVNIEGNILKLAYRMNFFIRKNISVKLELVSSDKEVAVFTGTIIKGYEKKKKTLYFFRMDKDHLRIEDLEGEIPLIIWSRKS